MIESVEGLDLKTQLLRFSKRHGEDSFELQPEGTARRRHHPGRVARRVAKMADSFRESGGIEPLIDGPVGNTIGLALHKIRIFEVIAVILAVITLIDELRTAGIVLEDPSNGPSTQKLPRQRVSVLVQLGNVV